MLLKKYYIWGDFMNHVVKTTKAQEFIDITKIVQKEVIKSKVKKGIAVD